MSTGRTRIRTQFISDRNTPSLFSTSSSYLLFYLHMSQQQQDFARKMALPASSSFSFTAPFPLPSSGPQPGMKQRRVSLALPSSPKVFPAWSFRDDTSIDSHVASNSPLAPEKKGKTKKSVSEEKSLPQPTAEKRQRKKWTEEETQMLVSGCNIVRIICSILLYMC